MRYNGAMDDAYRRLCARFPALRRVPVERLKRHWLTISFICGFITDLILLNKVDDLIDNLILLFYMLLSMASLLLLYAGIAEKFSERWSLRARTYAPLTAQYAFGGILSGILIFYGRSGSWFVSWPFLVVVIAVIAGNELLRQRAQRLVFNITILFLALFLYLVLLVPVLSGMMGAWVFIFSGLLALLALWGFLKALRRIVPNFLRANMRSVVFAIGAVYVGINALYFTNVIPPIPLSLKELGVYHNVERTDDGHYAVTYERGAWYQPFKRSNSTYRYQTGDTVFCFASVFAPMRLSTDVFHRWEYYVPEDREWRTHGRFPYTISGGRDSGFRGYTFVRSVHEGTWRCTVETARKQILGRKTFEIIEAAPQRDLVTELR